MIEGEGAPQQMIQDPARRADHQVRAGLERIELRAVSHPAVHGGGAHAGIPPEQFGFVRHLAGQLARGHEHQGLGDGPGRIHPGQDRQKVGAGFPAAGAGLDEHVAPGEEIRHRPGLHRHELGPARADRALAQILWQVGEGGWRKVVGTSGRLIGHAPLQSHCECRGAAVLRPYRIMA